MAGGFEPEAKPAFHAQIPEKKSCRFECNGHASLIITSSHLYK
jgi:hypothetical protein